MLDGTPGPVVTPPQLDEQGETTGLHPRLGRIIGLDAEGRPLVRFAGSQPRRASTLGPVAPAELEQAAREQRVVVLAFLDGRVDAPVLLSLHGPDAAPPPDPVPPAAPPAADDDDDELELVIDDERREITAARELTLRCGDASITLRSDGTVKIRGRDVTSWARRRQRIRGGSVSIN